MRATRRALVRRRGGACFRPTGFGPLTERQFRQEHSGPPAKVIVDRVLSISFIAALPQAERDRVAARIWELIAATPELAGKSEVIYPYRTEAYSCRRLDRTP